MKIGRAPDCRLIVGHVGRLIKACAGVRRTIKATAEATEARRDRDVLSAFYGRPSYYQLTASSVQNAASWQQHIASRIPAAKIDIIKVPGLSDALATE